MKNDDLLTALRQMDSADPAASPTSERARADLDLILSTRRDDQATTDTARAARPAGSSTGTRTTAGTRTARAPRRARWVLAAAAAVVGIGVVTPMVAPGPAYAGWVAMPQPAPAPIIEEAERACQEMWTGTGVYDPEGTGAGAYDEDYQEMGFVDPATMRAALTERRGPWTFTILRGPDGQLGDCLLGRSRLSMLGGGSGGGGMSGTPATPDPTGAELDTAMAGSLSSSPSWWEQIIGRDQAQGLSYVYGRAGEDVRGVVVHTPDQGEVTASVQNGIWAAWWPVEEGRYPSGLTATVTIADGTSRDVDVDELLLAWEGEDG
ncbi:hypothetical protein [Ornithinimicrobium panacihumi]|uniref:hypothetical protein n=1 Tax=Ornithinimicrobium panacihumi TaxID=2008449 RepID=UPI003F8B796F